MDTLRGVNLIIATDVIRGRTRAFWSLLMFIRTGRYIFRTDDDVDGFNVPGEIKKRFGRSFFRSSTYMTI